MESCVCLPVESVISCSQIRKLPCGDQPQSMFELTFPALLNGVSKNLPSLSHLPTNTPSFLVAACSSEVVDWARPNPLSTNAISNSRKVLIMAGRCPYDQMIQLLTRACF